MQHIQSGAGSGVEALVDYISYDVDAPEQQNTMTAISLETEDGSAWLIIE